MTRSSGFSPARLSRMREVMAGYVERGAVAGLVALLSRHDEVHVEAIGVQDLASGAAMRRDTIFRIASMTKPITAAAAMILVEEARLRLDDPVERFLPELSHRKVLRTVDSKLDDTVLADRPITLRDVLTFRLGIGAVMAPPGRYPIQQAIAEAGLAPGPNPISFSPDEWIRRFASLPLLHQPGEKWMYHTGSDLLGVLVARAAGRAWPISCKSGYSRRSALKILVSASPKRSSTGWRPATRSKLRPAGSRAMTKRVADAGRVPRPSRRAAAGWSRRPTISSPSAG